MNTKNIAAIGIVVAIALTVGALVFKNRKSDVEVAQADRNNAGSASGTAGATENSQPGVPIGGATSGTASLAQELDADQSGGSTGSQVDRRGPSIMSPENVQRAMRMNGKLRAADPEFSDLMEILEKEGRDEDWAQQVESSFDVALRSYGPGYSGLEVQKVRCGRTVCVMSAAVRSGTSPTSPNADWSRLLSNTFGEPWFGQNFMDTSTTLAPDDKGMIFISVFERKR